MLDVRPNAGEPRKRWSRPPNCLATSNGEQLAAGLLPYSSGWPLLLFLLGCVPGCAGYQLGARTLFSPEIRSVHVPVFQSDILRRNLSEWLTEAVVKELERSSSFKVVADPSAADSILVGRIAFESKRVLGETINDDPRNLEARLVVQVSWLDRRGQNILPNATFSLSQQGFSVTEPGTFIPEAGQSITSAHQTIVARVAREIVSQMEAPW